MKKKYIPCFLTLSLLLTMLMPIEALAGDINTAEQTVVDYCSGTFTHKGKEYQATQEALAAMRSKLIEDDVNLTVNQAASAKVQFSRKVAEGIEQGYLIEVKDEEGTDIEKPKDDKDEVKPDGNTEEGVPEGGQEEDKANGAGSGSDTARNSGEESGTAGNAGTGEGTAGNAGSGSDTKDNTSNGSDTAGGTGAEPDTNNNAAPKTQKQQSSASNKKPEEIEKIWKDIVKGKENNYEVLYRTDGKEYIFTSTVSIEEIEQINAKSVVYTIESYQDGTIWVGTKDGTAIFKGEMPIKNTGSYVEQNSIAAAVILLLLLTLTASIVLIVKERRGRIEHGKK